MDRLRVGLTGLGAVFLLTLGVSVTVGALHRDRPVEQSHKEPGETLAQLGVAPGSEKTAAAAREQEEAAPDRDGEREAADRSDSAYPGPARTGNPAAT